MRPCPFGPKPLAQDSGATFGRVPPGRVAPAEPISDSVPREWYTPLSPRCPVPVCSCERARGQVSSPKVRESPWFLPARHPAATARA